ncbi:hypothetical protein PR048_020308 [Dryococelus australis]|uniref:Uncharacterized protein n=1 Tax=Dryococelus australis TaxID=614101 RepID=A0ABQ9H618_9NEOP|nr:hypothetical protein PR048_020308 [Dryococelus australis]
MLSSMRMPLRKLNDHILYKTCHHKKLTRYKADSTYRRKNYANFYYSLLKASIFIDTILKDTQFWEQEIVPKLKKFYWECLLLEILDYRKARGHAIRDPESIENVKKEVAKRRKLSKSDRN